MQLSDTVTVRSRPRVRSLSSVELVLLLALALAFAAVGLGTLDASGRPDAPLAPVKVVSGDTLWSIAALHPVDGLSTQQVVDLIIDHNSLESSSLAAGEILLVPTQTDPDLLAMR